MSSMEGAFGGNERNGLIERDSISTPSNKLGHLVEHDDTVRHHPRTRSSPHRTQVCTLAHGHSPRTMRLNCQRSLHDQDHSLIYYRTGRVSQTPETSVSPLH